MPFISFANPAGLWFLPLAGLPLLIHLFRRRRAGVIPFPDIRLLQQVQNSAVRPSRIKEYLLLAVRTLILLLLALALARPVVNLKLPGWLSGDSQTCVIIVDNSASMAASSRDTTLLDRARQAARHALEDMGPNARAAVVSAVPGSPVVCGLSLPAVAGKALEVLPQTEFSTDLEGAIYAAAKILENTYGQGGRIFLFSDLQRTGFGPKLSPLNKLPGNPSITVYPIKSFLPLTNLIWQKVQVKHLIKKIIVLARALGGNSPQISLRAGGKIIYQATPIPGQDGMITLSFGLPDQDSLYLFTSGDDLPLDDKYYLAPADTTLKKVLLITDVTDDQNDYLYKAFAAIGPAGYAIKKVNTWNSQYSKDFDLVVIAKASIEKPLMTGVLKLLHNGAGLLTVPPINSNRNQYQVLARQFSDVTILGLADSLSHNIYRLSSSGSQGNILSDVTPADLDDVKIKTYWRIFTRQNAELKINRSDPVLIFNPDAELKTALLLTGSRPEFGDLVFKPAFLVMLLQIADHLTQKSLRQLVAGPDGKISQGQLEIHQKSGWIQINGRVSGAVNIAAAESDLTPVSGPELENILQHISWQPAGPGALVFSGQSQASRLFMFLAGLMLVLEMIIRATPKK